MVVKLQGALLIPSGGSTVSIRIQSTKIGISLFYVENERNLDSYSGRLKTALEKTITLKLLIQFKQKLYQWKERSKIYGVAI